MSTQPGDAKRTLSTGDLVISVSEIFDRLQTKVDPNTLEQLLRDILAGRRPQVRPGELITAELINQMLAELESLQVRVTKLEAGGVVVGSGVVITALQPSGPVRVQAELRILGRNFGLPSSCVVTIDGVTVRQFKDGSGDTLLILDVPVIAGVPDSGKNVTLTVSNAAGFAETSLVILPAIQTTPIGSLFVTLSQSPTDPELLAGQSYTFVFAVKAFSNMEEVFSLIPTVSTGWSAAIVDQSNNPITPAEVRIPKSDPPAGTTRDVRVRVAIPSTAAAATTAQLRLGVVSKRNASGFSSTSGGDPITVGEPPPPPQRVTVSFSAALAPGGAPPVTKDTNNVLVIPAAGIGITYRIDMSVMSLDAGNFNLTLTPPGGLWTARIESGSSTGQLAANQGRLVNLSLSAQAGAGPANIVLRATKSDDSSIFGQSSQPIRLGP